MVDLLIDGNAVLCHCSDGWDRTSQFCALGQIILDPYFRTIKGFEVLIEKDWVSYGYKFSDRCDHLKKRSDQFSPIFLQFIDCVYHLWQQDPNQFEFNEKFLLTIVEQTYSCSYGNFLFNNDRIGEKYKKKETTISLWTFVNTNIKTFKNPMYKCTTNILKLDSSVKKLSTQIWSTFYLLPGMRPKYQEMMSSFMNCLQKENNEMKMILDKEKNARKSLEDELKTAKERLQEYTDIIENTPEEIYTEKIDDDDYNIISRLTPRIDSVQKIKSSIILIEDHFK